MLLPLSIYIHLPWCLRKCPYCDFNSYTLEQTINQEDYLNALILDFKQELLTIKQRSVISIFIGGGTPSLFHPSHIYKLLNKLHKDLPLAANLEITMEANPGTVNKLQLNDFKAAGINRISFGVQSFNNNHLKQLGRIHNNKEAITVINAARRAGFNNLNLDLMFGIPEQNLNDAKNDLITACALEPEHISYYQLTIEQGTAFYYNSPILPDEDLCWEMQEQGVNFLNVNNYQQYEISAYAQNNCTCQHNLNYWEFGDYIGIGAGAHSKLTDNTGVRRYAKLKNPKYYMAALKLGNNQHFAYDEIIKPAELPFEFMLNALRLIAGVPIKIYHQRTGLTIDQIMPQLNEARIQNFIADYSERLVATIKGRQFLNELLEIFLPD